MAKSLLSVETGVSFLKTLTVKNSAALGRSHGSSSNSGRSKKKAGKNAFDDEIEALYPTIKIELKSVFNASIICRSAVECLASYVDFFPTKQDDMRMTARLLSVLLYGLPSGMTMSELKKGIGKQHVIFRYKLAKQVTRNALLITDEMFRAQEQQVLTDIVREGGSSEGFSAINRHLSAKPYWLAPDVLTSRVLNMARKQNDCVKSEWDPLPKTKDERRALYVCRFVYKTVIDMLRRARDRSRQRMFGAGLFLLVDWRKLKPFRDGHCNPTVRFAYPLASPIAPSEVQNCATASNGDHLQRNAGLLKQLVEARHEMVIEVTYNVTVTLQRKARSRGRTANEVRPGNEPPQKEIREMKRHVNILGIALAFMESYTLSPEETVLSAHPSMLRNIYRVALVLREFFIDELGVHTVPRSARLLTQLRDGPDEGNSEVPSTRFNNPTTDGSCAAEEAGTSSAIPEVKMLDILPSASEADKEMTKVLEIPLVTFEKMRVRNSGCDDLDDEEGDAGAEQSINNGLDSDEEEDLDDMLDN